MNIRQLVFLFACVLCADAKATQLIINFSGVQWRTPFYFQGGVNELEIHQGDPVHGSFILDLEGLVDYYPDDPMQLVANKTVQRAHFQSLTAAVPFGRIGPYGGASAYSIIGPGSIGIYANTLYAGPDGQLISDKYQLELAVKPGIIQNDRYDISNLKISDLNGVGEGASEPPRVCRRLHYLRGWSHEDIKQAVFPGSSRAIGSAGSGTPA